MTRYRDGNYRSNPKNNSWSNCGEKGVTMSVIKTFDSKDVRAMTNIGRGGVIGRPVHSKREVPEANVRVMGIERRDGADDIPSIHSQTLF